MPTTGGSLVPDFRMIADPKPGASQVHQRVRCNAPGAIFGSFDSPVAASRSTEKKTLDPNSVERLAKLSFGGAIRSDFRKSTDTGRDSIVHQGGVKSDPMS